MRKFASYSCYNMGHYSYLTYNALHFIPGVNWLLWAAYQKLMHWSDVIQGDTDDGPWSKKICGCSEVDTSNH